MLASLLSSPVTCGVNSGMLLRSSRGEFSSSVFSRMVADSGDAPRVSNFLAPGRILVSKEPTVLL